MIFNTLCNIRIFNIPIIRIHTTIIQILNMHTSNGRENVCDEVMKRKIETLEYWNTAVFEYLESMICDE